LLARHSDRTMMIEEKDLRSTVIDYATNKKWQISDCINCHRLVLSKKVPLQLCPRCETGKQFTVKVHNSFATDKAKPHLQIANRLEASFRQMDISRTESIPIWRTFSTEVFVGSGLEYLDGYRYRGLSLPKLPVVVFQPSIRLHKGIKENLSFYQDVTNYSSIAFINVSAINRLQEPHDFSLSLDNAISILSSIGIHATRICIATDSQSHHFEHDFSFVCRLFIDKLEVGDHVAIISKRGQENIVETGFGLERLTTRIYFCTYEQVMQSKHQLSDVLLLKALHALTLITMSSIPYSNEAPWSKAKTIANIIRPHIGKFDSFLAFRDMYDYWCSFVNQPLDKVSAYMQFLTLVE